MMNLYEDKNDIIHDYMVHLLHAILTTEDYDDDVSIMFLRMIYFLYSTLSLSSLYYNTYYVFESNQGGNYLTNQNG